MRRFVLCGSLVSLAGVASVDGERELRTSRQSSDTPLIQASPSLVISGTTSSDSSDFHRITAALLLPDGRAVVVDDGPRIRIFAQDGRPATNIGRQGEGPGEYQAISVLSAFGRDSLFVFDPRLMRASVLRPATGFVRAFTLASRSASEGQPVALGVFGDGTILSGARRVAASERGRTGVTRPTLILLRHDRRGNVVDSIGHIAGDEVALSAGILLRPGFLRRTLITVRGTEFLTTTSDSFVVTAHNGSGRVTRVIRESRPLQPVPAAKLAPLEQVGIRFTSRVTYPAILAVLNDDTGRSWIQAADSGWSVYAGTGHRLALVQMPRRFRPLQATKDAVIGVWQDSTDVEFLRAYRLNR